MVDNELLDREELPFNEWAITPAPDHLVPDSIEHEQESERFREQLNTQHTPEGLPAVVITHTDADGLSSAALLVEHLGENTAVRPVEYHGAYQFKHALRDLRQTGFGDTPIYISDFSPDDATVPDGLASLTDGRNCPAYWFDHHQWPDGAIQNYRDAGIDVTVDDSECATSLIHRELDTEWDDHLTELAEVTKDIDLWIRDDPRSPRLNTFASFVDDPWEYIDSVLEYGVDHSLEIEDRIDEQIAYNEELEQFAVEEAIKHDIGPYTVATTYVKGGRSSEIGAELCETPEHGVDIAIVLKAHGGGGVYSHSDGQGENPDPKIFSQCHEIAGNLGGGGHPTASGFSAPVDTFRELAEYWASCSGTVRPMVLEAAAQAIDSEQEETDG